MTANCQMCGHPVDMFVSHVTVTRQVEWQHRADIHVLDAEVMAYLHLTCATPLTHAAPGRAVTAS